MSSAFVIAGLIYIRDLKPNFKQTKKIDYSINLVTNVF